MKGLGGEEESTFYEPIKKNRLDFFQQVPASADSSKQKVLKEDCQLFSKLFISCQSRECDLSDLWATTEPEVGSSFRGKGKKSAWQTWAVCDEASGVFSKLSQYPPVVDDEDLKTLEKIVVMMYDRSSTAEGVDDARLDMFARKQRPYEAIPLTQSALKQHVKRAAYQAGCIWSQSTKRQPETQTPANWGWTKKGDLWQIVWTELSPIAESCQQLTKCGCKSECCSRCKCYCFGLTCTALCSCRCEI
ncbi:hypothetical protein ABVT39_024501 [Epinephelus coioides]